MVKRVILAVAGAGKTYYICHHIDPTKRNLILAYTHENIKNIRKELKSAFGHIPELTQILTFDSFIYRYLILPYEPSILKHFNKNDFKAKGITLQEPEPQTIKNKPNSRYIKKEYLGHYINRNGFYYCKRLSELIMYVQKEKRPLIKEIAYNINNFYHEILIDEFQDFREYNFNLIISLASEIDNLTLVGDYHQNSVSGDNNSGMPYKKGSKEVLYDEFKVNIENSRFVVDDNTLDASRRCPKNICEFVSRKLNIKFVHNNDNIGKVILLEQEQDIKNILENNDIVKLVYGNSKKYLFNAVNWSYSKGDTYDNTCVILTKSFEEIFEEEFNCSNISQITKNKLYVALTRTKGDLYIIKNNKFEQIKSTYLKKF